MVAGRIPFACALLAVCAHAAFAQVISSSGRPGVGPVAGAEGVGLQRLQITVFNELIPVARIDPAEGASDVPHEGKFIGTEHRFTATWGFHPLWDLNLVVPVLMDYAFETDVRSAGLGDVEGTIVLHWPRLFSRHRFAVDLTGTFGGLVDGGKGYTIRDPAFLREDGSRSAFGRGGFGAAAGFSYTRSWFGRVRPLLWHARARYVPGFGESPWIARVGTALEKRLPEGWSVGAWTEYERTGDVPSLDGEPHRLDVGGQVSFRTPRGFAVQGGVVGNALPVAEATVSGRGESYRAPVTYSPRFFMAFTMELRVASADVDRDGVPDHADGCPQSAEDKDGFMDNDGCPDPDNDGDGFCDPWVSEEGKLKRYDNVCSGVDVCPFNREDVDGFQDDDGCPDPDNDRDGIPDAGDRCPDAAEDMDGFQDDDGCPDPDNDGDGIPDPDDRCPLQREDHDGFQDEDGCPDLDNDGDGIPDVDDQCPERAETFNGFRDEDGCPDDEEVTDEVEAIRDGELTGLRFEEGVAEWPMESFGAVDSLARAMIRHRTAKIVVEFPRGADDRVSVRGGSLAARRLDSVVQYLISRGVDRSRVTGELVEGTGPVRIRLR